MRTLSRMTCGGPLLVSVVPHQHVQRLEPGPAHRIEAVEARHGAQGVERVLRVLVLQHAVRA